MNVKTIKRPTFIEALVPITFLIIIISVSILKFGADPQIPLLLATIVAVLLGFKLGYKWDDMEKGMISTINSSMQAILIQMIIGIIDSSRYCSYYDLLWITNSFSSYLLAICSYFMCYYFCCNW